MKTLTTNYNSNLNQSIKGKFVNNEVIECVTSAVEDLIKAHYLDSSLGFDVNEYLTPYYTASDGEDYTYDEAQEKIQELEDEDGNEDLIEELQNADFEEWPEVYEYWSVSDRLGKRLKAMGEIVIEECGLCIWGRQTTGQAILLDYVISLICEEMEILEGQKYEWKC